MKKLILLLFTLFLTACTVDPNFTSPPTGNKRTDFLNQAQKTISTIGAKYGYECKRGSSPGKGTKPEFMSEVITLTFPPMLD